MNSQPIFSTASTSPEEELAFIRKVILDSRRAMIENGKPYIYWGCVVAFMMTLTYIEALLGRPLIGGNYYITGWLWLGFGVLFGGMSIAWSKKTDKDKQVKSFADRLAGAIWAACGGTLGLLLITVFVGRSIDPQLDIDPLLVCPLVSFILGIAYYLSAIVNDLPWMKWIATAWWVGAVGMFFIHSVHVLGIYAAMIICFQVVPGLVMHKNYNRQLQAA